MMIEEATATVCDHELQIGRYTQNAYQFYYDIFFMKNFYELFNFMKLSHFIDAMRFLSKVSLEAISHNK